MNRSRWQQSVAFQLPTAASQTEYHRSSRADVYVVGRRRSQDNDTRQTQRDQPGDENVIVDVIKRLDKINKDSAHRLSLGSVSVVYQRFEFWKTESMTIFVQEALLNGWVKKGTLLSTAKTWRLCETVQCIEPKLVFCFWCFLSSYTKAFDMVSHSKLFRVLLEGPRSISGYSCRRSTPSRPRKWGRN